MYIFIYIYIHTHTYTYTHAQISHQPSGRRWLRGACIYLLPPLPDHPYPLPGTPTWACQTPPGRL